MKERVSTFFLRTVIVFIGIAVLALCVFAFPNIWKGATVEWPMLARTLHFALTGIFATTIPFFFALYQAFKLLHHIDKNNAFSELSIKALRNIKYCAIAMAILYMAVMPFAFALAEFDDAPGAVLIAFAIACSPLTVATFAAVLQKLVQNALCIKLENDLTV